MSSDPGKSNIDAMIVEETIRTLAVSPHNVARFWPSMFVQGEISFDDAYQALENLAAHHKLVGYATLYSLNNRRLWHGTIAELRAKGWEALFSEVLSQNPLDPPSRSVEIYYELSEPFRQIILGK